MKVYLISKKLWAAGLQPKGNEEDLTTGHEMQQAELCWTVLSGLPKEYDIVVTILESSIEELNLDATLPKLLQVEQRIQQKPQQFKRIQQKPQKDKQGVMQVFGAVQRKCFFCNQLGHIKAHCNKRKADVQRNGIVATVAC